jgi:hypothetical protein
MNGSQLYTSGCENKRTHTHRGRYLVGGNGKFPFFSSLKVAINMSASVLDGIFVPLYL